ncbi:MAG: spermidine synthase [Geobacteraceae bacterium]|nr:spermidine synthase [Geobacteraceae bacterium]
MAQPWKVIESVATADGTLELRQRGERDFLIVIGGQVLMNSLANRSEIVLGQHGCAHLKGRTGARVLVGGLGMGCTLRGVLDTLTADAQVVVAELNPVVPEWCRGPLALLTDSAITDCRVMLEICDVTTLIRSAAASGGAARFDAIVLDLYRGPHARTDRVRDPFYGSRAIESMRKALLPGGVLAVWGENYDEGYVQRLRGAGFTVATERPGRGGLRHVVFLARLPR